MISGQDRIVFVTVGTTKFDDLIRAVDQVEFADALKSKGYSKLIIQKGAGQYLPRCLVPEGSSSTLPNRLKVEWFEFLPSLAQMLESAALVISHAGSGSIFEALSLRKPVIVVPNPKLMHNHQAELAQHLESLKYLVSCPPDQLLDGVKRLYNTQLQPYPRNTECNIVSSIDQLMGLKQSS